MMSRTGCFILSKTYNKIKAEIDKAINKSQKEVVGYVREERKK